MKWTDELSARVVASKMGLCAVREGRRTERGKSFASRRSTWDMACLISYKGAANRVVELRVQDWQDSLGRGLSTFIISYGSIVRVI